MELSVPEYVEEAFKRLDQEADLAEKYYPDSKRAVIKAIENRIIIQPHKLLANVVTCFLRG